MAASPEDDPAGSQTVNGPLGQGPFMAGSEYNTTTRVFKTVCWQWPYRRWDRYDRFIWELA